MRTSRCADSQAPPESLSAVLERVTGKTDEQLHWELELEREIRERKFRDRMEAIKNAAAGIRRLQRRAADIHVAWRYASEARLDFGDKMGELLELEREITRRRADLLEALCNDHELFRGLVGDFVRRSLRPDYVR